MSRCADDCAWRHGCDIKLEYAKQVQLDRAATHRAELHLPAPTGSFGYGTVLLATADREPWMPLVV
jgi:hypothetical protein